MINHRGTDTEGEIIITNVEAIKCVFDKPFPRLPDVVLAPGDKATYELTAYYELCDITTHSFCIIFYNPAALYRLRYFIETVEIKPVKQPNHWKKSRKSNK